MLKDRLRAREPGFWFSGWNDSCNSGRIGFDIFLMGGDAMETIWIQSINGLNHGSFLGIQRVQSPIRHEKLLDRFPGRSAVVPR